MRARGQATVAVRPAEYEIALDIKGKVDIGKDGSSDVVDVTAPDGAEVVVTLVDEGINILTGEETPDPIGCFAEWRTAKRCLYDIYHRVLPVLGMDALKVSGVKTGGGFGAEMLSRVSPVPTRRFKPLALWREKVSVVNGKASATFRLPEFVGEVRVTAVAYNKHATGSKSVQLKVSPKLVAMPDAPRFVAPNDKFDVSLPVYNRRFLSQKTVRQTSHAELPRWMMRVKWSLLTECLALERIMFLKFFFPCVRRWLGVRRRV